jgi:hypothetical protein
MLSAGVCRGWSKTPIGQPSDAVHEKRKTAITIPMHTGGDIGCALGDFVELTAEHGTIVLRPKQLTDKPIPESTPTAAEVRALNRVIAADKGGETTPYEQYRSQRAARLAGRRTSSPKSSIGYRRVTLPTSTPPCSPWPPTRSVATSNGSPSTTAIASTAASVTTASYSMSTRPRVVSESAPSIDEPRRRTASDDGRQ